MKHDESKSIDRWIPWMFVGCFIVVIVVNVIMMTLAIKTNRGIVTDQAYKIGLNYNRYLEKDKKQVKLSWKTDLIVQQDNVILRVQDKENHFVQGADVKVTFIRPTQDGYDRHITLNENWSSQMYQSKLNLPLKGQWQANISITKDGFTYHQNQMIIYE